MKQLYADITKIAAAAGVSAGWYDEHGVPRFCRFHPAACADPYADEVALLRIACQNCRKEFLVAVSLSKIERMISKSRSLAQIIHEDKELSYGDPPNAGCCAAGPVMCSETLEIVEFWQYQRMSATSKWVRNPGLEIKLEEDQNEETKELNPYRRDLFVANPTLSGRIGDMQLLD